MEVPDNWSHDSYYNLPLDELMSVMRMALKKGYTLVWDGDIGHEGFSYKNQLAIVPEGDGEFTSPQQEKDISADYR